MKLQAVKHTPFADHKPKVGAKIGHPRIFYGQINLLVSWYRGIVITKITHTYANNICEMHLRKYHTPIWSHFYGTCIWNQTVMNLDTYRVSWPLYRDTYRIVAHPYRGSPSLFVSPVISWAAAFPLVSHDCAIFSHMIVHSKQSLMNGSCQWTLSAIMAGFVMYQQLVSADV